MTTCKNKRPYRDRIAAEFALAKFGRKNTPAYDVKRSYRCPHCKKWHLTSQDKRR